MPFTADNTTASFLHAPCGYMASKTILAFKFLVANWTFGHSKISMLNKINKNTIAISHANNK